MLLNAIFLCKQTTYEPEIMPDDLLFIPGIDRYCDRWCDRCAVTSKCRYYIHERQSHSGTALDEPFIFNAAFWTEMDRQLSLLLQDIVSESEVLPALHARLSPHRSAREHPCSQAALEYAGMVDRWKDSGKIWPLYPEEAGEIIRQYCYFLYPKLVRAIEVGMTSDSCEGCFDDDHEHAEGTAKTVLIAIDRSLAAWGLVYRDYPEYEDAVLLMLLHLDRLRKSVEAVFPGARSFHRPGLDG